MENNTEMVRFSINFLDRHNKGFMVEKLGDCGFLIAEYKKKMLDTGLISW